MPNSTIVTDYKMFSKLMIFVIRELLKKDNLNKYNNFKIGYNLEWSYF